MDEYHCPYESDRGRDDDRGDGRRGGHDDHDDHGDRNDRGGDDDLYDGAYDANLSGIGGRHCPCDQLLD